MQLHAGHTLEAGAVEIDGVDPLADRERRALHRGPGADAEIPLAVAATIGLRLPVLGLVSVGE